MPPLLSLLPIVPRHLPTPIDTIFVDHQALQSHRSPRMDLIRANAHLSAKTKSHPIRHPRTRVPKNACRIHTGLKLICYFRGRGQNGISVLRRVGVDVGDCETARGAGGSARGCRDGFDGENRSEEFGCVVFFCCVLEYG